MLDVAVALALGGDCLADVGLLRAEPGVFGAVASDPTVSRLIATLAADAPKALAAIDSARASARAAVWAAAGKHAPDQGIDADHPVIIDLDATLVTAHSGKEKAAPTFKRGFGFHPLCAFVDHGSAGTGESLAILLRPGNAGSNSAADHKTVLASALAQLPIQVGHRVGKKVLVRTDAAGATREFLNYVTARRLSYSLGFALTETMAAALDAIPEQVWTPAYDADRQVRDGAWVAEATGVVDLSAWPAGMRLIVQKRTPPSRRPAAPHRPRRATTDRVRHQHRPRATARPRAAPPPPHPLRRPHPDGQRHRPGQPPPARIRPKPHLVRVGATGYQSDRLAADAGFH
jgi:hypothetical protein